jgi:hypothetical protein
MPSSQPSSLCGNIEAVSEAVRRKRPGIWPNDWFLHNGNAQAQKTLSIKKFLAQNSIIVKEHPPYSPDLVPNDFWLFPNIKSTLKG